MGTLVLIAIRNLLQHRKRTLLLGSAIALVTMLLVLLSALFNGMQSTMLRTATTLMTGHINVGGFYKITAGTVAPVVTKYQDLLDIVREETPGLTAVVVRGRGWGKLVSDVSSQQSAIAGIDITEERGFRDVVQVKRGDIEGLREPGSALIFESQAERLEVKVGDTITISAPGFRGANNTVDVRVVAIAANLGFVSGFNAYIHHDSLRALYQLDPTTTGALQVYLADPEQAGEVAAKLRKAIADRGHRVMDAVAEPFWRKFEVVRREDWTGQKIDVTTWMDEMAFMRWTLNTLSMLIVILVTVLVLIIVVGVMNTLWMSIRERTREVGTLRAIGMSRWRVLWMFVIEAAVLAVAATAVGALLAVLLATGLNAAEIVVARELQVFLMSETLRLQVDVPTAVRSLAIIAAVTTVGALFPAWRAARLQPVTAMHAN